MRLDKFLKITRIIKRRTIANELCDLGNVEVNNSIKKALYSVKTGDLIKIKYFNKVFEIKVLELPLETLKKDDIQKYIEVRELI